MKLPSLKHKNNFNLLRLVFAVLVLLSHAPELIDGNRSRELLTQIFHTLSFGEFAVDGFFLLSGYLIVQSWLCWPHGWGFLTKRILRIYPGFVASSLICVSVVGPLAANPNEYFSNFWFGGFVKSLLTLAGPNPSPVFHGTFYAVLNGAMWTIRYEFACYLLVFLFGVLGALRDRRLWLGATSFVLILFLLQQIGIVQTLTYPVARLASFFFSGGCFYLYRNRIMYTPRLAALMASALFVSLFFVQSAEIALATCGAYLLFYFACTPVALLAHFNRLPDVSYGVYLYGWPVQKLFLWYFPSLSPWKLFPLSLTISLILGAISWYVVEKPMMRFKSPSRWTTPEKSGAVVTIP